MIHIVITLLFERLYTPLTVVNKLQTIYDKTNWQSAVTLIY